MNHRSSDPARRHEDKWLEKSLVAPSPPLLYERSDGEKAASERLIREKAKTERWNRGISRALFGLRLFLGAVPVTFLLGTAFGLWLGRA